ncbi:hypothetical protein VAZ01S_077_00120 [Vibrio azureus NBRC 104587]|uniref:Uncharacterized protein n=1 Tax=Vibrio azureus NBRC 104587 TaxID=1219077 RepID=U3AUP5_9VIBR|nr:hypothetical protein VAZ01S_077_00120 [Vibrio azureus NBRC 104587]
MLVLRTIWMESKLYIEIPRYLFRSENNLLIRILTIEQRGKGALVSAPFTCLCLASLSLTWVLKINTGYFFSKYRMYSVNLLNWRNLQF